MIRGVSTSFVPVAVNLYKVRELQDAGGALFRSIQKQKDQFQGIWIVSPDGKVLSGYGGSSHVVFSNGDVDNAKSEAAWIQVVRETIAAALREFGEVTPRRVQADDSTPRRGVGLEPDGGVILALYARYIAYNPLRSDSDNHVNIDSLHLNADAWSDLAPPRLEVGVEWQLPAPVARAFCRALCPVSDSDGWPTTDEISDATFTGRVEAIENGVARLSYRGHIAGVHTAVGQNASGLEPGQPKPTFSGDAVLTGRARFDTAKNAMRTLMFVFEGTSRRYTSTAEARPMAAVVEWRSDLGSP